MSTVIKSNENVANISQKFADFWNLLECDILFSFLVAEWTFLQQFIFAIVHQPAACFKVHGHQN